MTVNRLFNVLGSIVVVAGITAAVLPGRQTPAVINAVGQSFTGLIRAATGT